jgi:hypothetical protein
MSSGRQSDIGANAALAELKALAAEAAYGSNVAAKASAAARLLRAYATQSKPGDAYGPAALSLLVLSTCM